MTVYFMSMRRLLYSKPLGHEGLKKEMNYPMAFKSLFLHEQVTVYSYLCFVHFFNAIM